MPIGFENTSDPRKLAQNQRGLVQQRGDQLLQDQQNQASTAGDRADQAQGWLDSYLQSDVEGNGGYNPTEAGAINNAGQLDQYGITPDQAASNYLTPEEQAGIRGDTNYHANFNPDQMSQAQAVSAGKQRQAVSGLQQGLKGAIDPSALKQSGKFQQDSENQLNANQGQFGTVLNSEAANVRGAIDPSAVNPSSKFLNDYKLTPEQQQDIVTGAGISAGAGYRASEGTVDRAARAAGASPMGVAAYRARSERDSAAVGGDAMTQARIAASDAAAKRELTGEQLRENAGQFLTNTKTGTELAMGGQAIQGTQALGDQALQQRNTEEQNRQAAEQYLTGANLNAATTGGEADIANEANVNAQGRQQAQFNATTGAGIAQTEDAANSNRAGAIATNRQNTGVQNQNTAYNQGLTKTALESQQAKTVADTRLGARTGAINNYTGQQQQQNQNQQNADNRQVQTYGVQTGGTNDATKTGLAASQTPTTTDKIIGGALGAASAFLADGTPGTGDDSSKDPWWKDLVTHAGDTASNYIFQNLPGGGAAIPLADGGTGGLSVVGEDGPEWIGKAGGAAGNLMKSGIVRPSMYSQMGANLGKSARGALDQYRAKKREADPATATIDPQVSNPGAYGPANPAGSVTNYPRPVSEDDQDTQDPSDYLPQLADGKIVTNPTLALLDKSDQVVPLGYRAKAKVRPSAAFGRQQPTVYPRPYGEVA